MTCTAETVSGRCDLDEPPRYIHDCNRDDDHSVHECACGYRWVEVDE